MIKNYCEKKEIKLEENCFEENVPIVVGTTGWYKHYKQIIELCNNKKGTLFTATNFSIGVKGNIVL